MNEQYIEDAAKQLLVQRNITTTGLNYDFELMHARVEIQKYLDIQNALKYADREEEIRRRIRCYRQ